MLSTNMMEKSSSRIEFPNKDPEEWKLFYRFIDPSIIGDAHQMMECAAISEESVMKLTPWFHEFQMESYMQKCDDILAKKVGEISKKSEDGVYDNTFWDKDTKVPSSSFWSRGSRMARRRSAFGNIIELLQFSCLYDLHKTRIEAENVIGHLLNNFLSQTIDLFCFEHANALAELSLPLTEVQVQSEGEGGNKKHLSSAGKTKVLWDFFEKNAFEQRSLVGITPELINSSGILPSLTYTFLLLVERDRVAGKVKRELEIVRSNSKRYTSHRRLVADSYVSQEL